MKEDHVMYTCKNTLGYNNVKTKLLTHLFHCF